MNIDPRFEMLLLNFCHKLIIHNIVSIYKNVINTYFLNYNYIINNIKK